jgi:dCMP deaminase
MPSLNELDSVYMQMAQQMATLSKAKRAKVGAVMVTSHGVIIPGVNGMPAGLSNECEHTVGTELVTKAEVLHAELSCILKAAKEGVSAIDSTVYVTLSPCLQCSAMLAQTRVKRVVFGEAYRDTSGILLLRQTNIEVTQHASNTNHL